MANRTGSIASGDVCRASLLKRAEMLFRKPGLIQRIFFDLQEGGYEAEMEARLCGAPLFPLGSSLPQWKIGFAQARYHSTVAFLNTFLQVSSPTQAPKACQYVYLWR
jgi:hypothetical protein